MAGVMQTIVLDDHGRAWDAQSATLRSFLRCPVPDFDFLTYLIDNLGFVVVTKVAPRSVRIRMRPETASQTSIAAALFFVADAGCERIAIAHSDDGVVERLFPTFAQAVAYIGELVATSHAQTSCTFNSRELSIDTLANGVSPLSALFNQWVYSSQSYDAEKLRDALIGSGLQRFMVVEPVGGRLTIVDIGSGFEAFGKTWRDNAPGMLIEEQPDYDYGRWVQSMYCSVLQTHKPRLDNVDATIRRPHMNDRIRVRYQRLILPFAYGSHGRTPLVGASVLQQTSSPGA